MYKKTETTVPLSVDTVNETIEYIEKHIMEELTPNQISSQLYISVSTMNILFKTICGMTLMEYIRNRRLSLAGQDLMKTEIPIIELAYSYGYETPEAFTKAFTRCYGIPPSIARRTLSGLNEFQPIRISINLVGGWTENSDLTKSYSERQEIISKERYDGPIKHKGGLMNMETDKNAEMVSDVRYHINTEGMKEKESWKTLLALSEELKKKQISFKVDGKTMIFAHGLEFPLEKICLTFCWSEEEKIKNFFDYEGQDTNTTIDSFKYFDSKFRGMQIRCMFYNDVTEDGTYKALYRNAEPVEIDGNVIMVQTLEFYQNNAEKNTKYYRMVTEYLQKENH